MPGRPCYALGCFVLIAELCCDNARHVYELVVGCHFSVPPVCGERRFVLGSLCAHGRCLASSLEPSQRVATEDCLPRKTVVVHTLVYAF